MARRLAVIAVAGALAPTLAPGNGPSRGLVAVGHSGREREWWLRRRLVDAELAQAVGRDLRCAAAESGQVVARIDVTARQRVDRTGRQGQNRVNRHVDRQIG